MVTSLDLEEALSAFCLGVLSGLLMVLILLVLFSHLIFTRMHTSGILYQVQMLLVLVPCLVDLALAAAWNLRDLPKTRYIGFFWAKNDRKNLGLKLSRLEGNQLETIGSFDNPFS